MPRWTTPESTVRPVRWRNDLTRGRGPVRLARLERLPGERFTADARPPAPSVAYPLGDRVPTPRGSGDEVGDC